jgi:ABC-2 type transport system ATP-binding protein
MAADAAIDVEGLVKTFGPVRALDGLDLTVDEGEVHGFLGPNGAGKTTTIRVLLGLLRSDSGRAVLLGLDPWHDAVEIHRHLAYVPGDVNLWPKLTGGEVIDMFGRLRGDLDPRRRDELVERFELDPTKRARTYSKGNRQKVALVAALASSARLLLLDEPTAGLDPVMEAVFQQTVREVTADGRTVLLSSHILGQVDALCERVTIIRAGRTVQTGDLAEMRHLRRTTLEAETREPVGDLSGLDGVTVVDASDRKVHLEVDGTALDTVVHRLSAAGLVSLVSTPPSLEELFLAHYGDELAADMAHGAQGTEG